MDGLLILIGLIVLAIPVAVVVLLVGQSRLKARVADLERRLALIGEPALKPAAPVVTKVWPTTAPPIPDEALVADSPEPPPPLHPEPAPDGPIVMRADRATALAHWMQRNWIYVVSAVSLALAGVFLVQYSVQNGLLPPWARVVAAYLLGAMLIGAGEWLRRRGGDTERSDTAYLPSVFAGAGIVTLFAATTAARQLYDLIGPNPAFALHVLTAGLAIVLGWFYGPLLAAIGLIGAFAAPFLVSSGAGPTPALYAYYALIGATGLAVDAVRRWAWLSVLGLVLAYAGASMMMTGGAGQGAWIGFLVLLPVLSILLPPLRMTPDHAGPTVLQAFVAQGQSGWPPFPVRLAAGSVLTSSVALLMLQGDGPLVGMVALAALALLAVALLVWAEPAEGLADLALLPAVAFVLRVVFEAVNYWPLAEQFMAQAITDRAPETAAPMTVTWIVGMATLISAGFAWRALRGGPLSLIHGLTAVLVAPVTVALLDFVWSPALVLGDAAWAAHPMVLAVLTVALATRFARTDGADHRRMAYATLSALSLIALSLFLLTSATALTLALAVLAVVAAALDRRFNLREMGLFIQIAVAVLSYRLLIDPGLDWAIVAPLGQVVLVFAGIIAAQVAALRLVQDRHRVMTVGVLESAAMALAAVFANVLLTRWLVPEAVLDGAVQTYYVAALNAMPWLVVMLTQAYRAGFGGPLRPLRQVLSAVAGLFAALGLFWSAVTLNPLFSYAPGDIGALVIGPPILDTLALAYALPGVMMLIAAWRLALPRPLTLGLLAVGSALLALYAGLEIRRFWQGDWLGRPGVTQYELYSYTIALMLVGAALLYQSIARPSVTLRRIGMTVIALTIAKVFLIDAAGLTGLTRVFSFLGLGLSLAGLAWLNRWAGQVSAK